MTVRVARVITRLNVGGPAYQAVLLNHLLPARGYETLLICGRCQRHEPQFDRLLVEYPCEVVFCPHLQRPIRPGADVAAVVEVARILRRLQPDIVHTHTAKAGLVGRLAARWCRSKAVVHTFHGHVLEGYFSRPMTRGLLATERRLARITDRIVTVSDRLGRELTERFAVADPAKVAVVELGLPLARFLTLPSRGSWRGKLGIAADAVVFGSLGRLVTIKNFARMVDVFAGTITSFPNRDLHLIIGGTGPLRARLAAQIAAAGLSGRVHLVGLVEELGAFYADIDVAILTSDNEGTPAMLLEAQAAGRFVIAPDVGGIADVVSPGAGIVVTPNETKAYIEAIRSVLGTPSVPVVGRPEREAVVGRFSPQRLVDRIDRLYGEVVEEKTKYKIQNTKHKI